MRLKKMRARILSINKSGISYYGNPHHYITIEDENGDIYEARTITDGACGYGIKNKGLGKNAGVWDVTYHITRNENMMIDFLN